MEADRTGFPRDVMKLVHDFASDRVEMHPLAELLDIYADRREYTMFNGCKAVLWYTYCLETGTEQCVGRWIEDEDSSA